MNDFQLTNPENADLCDASKSQWYLDHALAARIAEWALRDYPNAKRLRVLEPSAGRGALAMAVRPYVAEVVCCDIDPQNAEYLRRLGFEVHEGDFLKWWPDRRFDLSLMNSPFEDGQTEQHIGHALKHCDRVVAHGPLTTLAGVERAKTLWSNVSLPGLVIHPRRPKYSGSKRAGETDMATFKLDYSLDSYTRVEWWL